MFERWGLDEGEFVITDGKRKVEGTCVSLPLPNN